MKARELGRGGIVVGDVVSLTGDVSGQPGTLARVVRVRPRTSALRRSADDTDPIERVMIANADQLVIVCALADPPPRPRLIDRFLVAAFDAGLTPLLCLTKADLASPDEILAAYQPLGVRYLVTGRPLTESVLNQLRGEVADKVSVLVGHSGVGKSTLFNALIPDASRAIGTVSPVTGRGRHTSSSALALRLPGGGWIIDTPGLRSFGLGHVSAENVIKAFPDLAEGAATCQPGCGHLDASCNLDAWAASHGATARLYSLRRLLFSREGRDPADPAEADSAQTGPPSADALPADPGEAS
jgi:ribosome biogenesis GTPase / thiamine phosphate phosphatase